ncbi:MAG: hypothetical protein LRY57_00230 [Alphaproteobacteria bacterium]|nr:hypothetical protein [Alphaproteobacteria bacterium]MCD8525777.1 hypothetical protein [Alphaproteobacteria bacterium]
MHVSYENTGLESKSDFVKGFISNPLETYKEIAQRLKQYGPLAPMPEFEPAVRFLQEELCATDIIEFCKQNPFAQAQRDLCLNALWHVDLDFSVSPDTGGYHQHKPPASGRFPYQATLKAIEDAITFFDSYERSRKRGHDTHYQLDRYRYHGLTLPHLPDWVVAPTNDVLTLTDLIAVRSVPIGLTMVASRTDFIDAYFNSPLNGKIHDDNHNRRFRSENQGYFERNGIITDEQKMQAYEHFDDIIQNKILPAVKITADMPAEEKQIRKAMIVLYFEWLHEYAKTPDRASLLTELKFQPDGPSAFEVVTKPGETPDGIEARRLPNRNLDSGAIFTGGMPGCGIHYFMDRGRNFLTSAYNKVTHGFYDNPEGTYSTDSEFPDKPYRTVEIFTEAVKRMMVIHDIDAKEADLTDEKIAALLENRVDGELLGKNLETYPGHDPDDPLNQAPRVVGAGGVTDSIAQGFQMDWHAG